MRYNLLIIPIQFKGGFMDFTVYHATGTLFLKSIINEGLKPVDLDSKYKVREALCYLLEIVPSEYGTDNEKYRIFVNSVHTSYGTIEDFIKQENGLFQHGSLYVNTGLEKTKEFALNRVKASELVTYAFHLYNFCKDFEWFGNIDFESQFNDKFSELIKIFAQENMPVVLSFETNTKFIAAETGSDSKEYIDWFRNYLDSNEMRQRMSESLRIIDTHVISPENIWICVYSDGYWSETVKLIDFAIDN